MCIGELQDILGNMSSEGKGTNPLCYPKYLHVYVHAKTYYYINKK